MSPRRRRNFQGPDAGFKKKQRNSRRFKSPTTPGDILVVQVSMFGVKARQAAKIMSAAVSRATSVSLMGKQIMFHAESPEDSVSQMTTQLY